MSMQSDGGKILKRWHHFWVASKQAREKRTLQNRLEKLRDPSSLTKAMAKLDGESSIRRIFIMGCGRSGTWLLTSLFSTYHDVQVVGEESPLERFGLLPATCSTMVMKRDFKSHERAASIPDSIHILWIVRHPYDVLTSNNPNNNHLYHIQPHRLISEMDTLRSLKESGRRNMMVVRYEDLVANPQSVQKRIAEAYSLKVVADCHKCTEHLAHNDEAIKAMHGVRAIDQSSLQKHLEDPQKIQHLRALQPRIKPCCDWLNEQYGYSMELPTPPAIKDKLMGMELPLASRFETNPLITPASFDGPRHNINGPSVIRVPEWLPNPLGKYYMYFASHTGKHIDLACADRPEGPWRLHPGGTLKLEDAAALRHHIASPDVHVDHENKCILMFYHGVAKEAEGQWTCLATSPDGIEFESDPTLLGSYYFRVWKWKQHWYALAKTPRDDMGWGQLYRSSDPRRPFECRGNFLEGMRHAAVLPQGDRLEIYYTRIGDAPERILLSVVDMRPDWKSWRASEPVEILRPVMAHEGADFPMAPSRAGEATKVNQLRDPCVLLDDGKRLLYYTIAGEMGICGAELQSAQ